MKKSIVSAFIAVFIVLSLVSCGSAGDTDTLWKNALYKEDTVFGAGKNTIETKVKVGDRSVLFTVNTDKETLGDALIEFGLIDGDISDFGLYVKFVNGIKADFDVDQSYWALYINGEMAMQGIDNTSIADGEHYELVYTK